MLFKDLFITEEKLQSKLKRMGFDMKKVKIYSDESIDYEGDVDLSKKQLTVIPIAFRKVYGNFDVSNNSLRNLTNAPVEVYGDFNIDYNFIIDISNSPKIVTGDYHCKYTKLKDITKKDIQAVTKVGGKIYVD